MAELYVVHCVDTEGPMYESLKETFYRINRVTGLDIKASRETLDEIQRGTYPLNGLEETAKSMFSPRVLDYKKDWSEIDEMLGVITSNQFRMKYKDSNNRGWQYSWFIMDWPDLLWNNPRRRDVGYNNVWNHYCDYYEEHNIHDDSFEWHVHPLSVYKEAHKNATAYYNSPNVYESLAHRIIDCGDFPRCFRPGFHTERPDSHLFLEQFIPYDYGNQNVELTEDEKNQPGADDGRFGDWRRASGRWGGYHPAYDDYQSEGNCHRWIFRSLNVGTRIKLLTQFEVDKAFEQVANGEDTILAICDHDYRDMSKDVDDAYSLIIDASKRYPDVKWSNSSAFEAAKVITDAKAKPLKMKASLEKKDYNAVLMIETDEKTFGSQPFLAIKTKGNRYIADNFDFQIPYHKWTYTFDEHTVPLRDLEYFGVAANSDSASGELIVMDASGSIELKKNW